MQLDHDHLCATLATSAGVSGDWNWCIICGAVTLGDVIRLPLAALEGKTGHSNSGRVEIHPLATSPPESPVRAPVKAVTSPDPEARREDYLTRARFFYRDTKGKDYVPKQSELDGFADGLEAQYQRTQVELPEEMVCNCPWQWPQLVEGVIWHHTQCSMVGLHRLGTKQYFDGKEGYYHGGVPRHGGTT